MTTLIITADKIGLASLARWLKELNKRRAYNAKVRQTIKELSALSTRELNDIGISRGDIYNIATGDETLERVRRQENTNLKGWV